MKSIVITFLLIFCLLYAPRATQSGQFTYKLYKHLPAYLLEYCKAFKVPVRFSDRFSFAESSHDTNAISDVPAYGRYQITQVYLDWYCWVNGFDKIKDVRAFLLNDRTNCYLFHWSVAYWRRKGYDYHEFVNVWLFGEAGYLSGRYSQSFVDKIL